MLKDPIILGYLIGVVIVVCVGYGVMTIFVGCVKTFHSQVEEERKRKKEEEKKQRFAA